MMAKAKSGYRKPRKKRPNERVGGYDSGLEKRLHEGVLKRWKVHPEQLAYIIKSHYHPDFGGRKIKGINYIIEAKGRFWDSKEYSKYLWIRESLPEDYKLIFIFENPNTPMPNAKKRKDGTKRTMGEWAESHGFEYYTEANFPKELR